jgi:pimeloyl-ACP methyl ester carboxylesterase
MPQSMKKIQIAFLLGSLLLLPACNPGAATAPPEERIPLHDCQLSAPGSVGSLAAKCGELSVYEDRTSGSGRRITLNIAVIPAVSRNPAPDPLFFLTGGPGQAATESFLQLSPAFEQIHQKRDIILVDQRGTGKSNPLNCPILEDENLEDLPSDADLSAFLEECLSSLDANPALYTTSLAMDDLDDVRASLGYDLINLYGVSYGTRAALTYLDQHPQHVRTAILDGTVAQDIPLGQDTARDAQRALNQIFLRCEADEDCRQAFPGVRSEFVTLLENLKSQPVQVSVAHPITGKRTEYEFTADKLASAVRLLTYAPETAALLPFLIHTAQSGGDLSLLASQYLIVSDQLTDSISEGMNYSVLCAEDVPFFSPEEAEQAGSGTYLGDLTVEGLYQVCKTWPKAEVPASFKEPVQSEVPVLLLSGESDPVTPPEYAERAANTLSNNLLLVAPGQGHNVIFRGCIPSIAGDFIENGSVQNLDTACVSQIQPMPFFLSFTGPNP